MSYEDALQYWLSDTEQKKTVSTLYSEQQMADEGHKRRPTHIVFTDITDELENPTEPSYLVDGLLEDGTTGMLFGESTAGKSFLAVSLACSVSTGKNWANHDLKRSGPVIYFAGEGRTGLPRRVKAWEECHDTKIPKYHFYLPKVRIEFTQAGSKIISEEISKLPEPPVLVIIDTMSRSLPADADENSAKDMMAFFNAVDSLRNRFGCVVCLVHHTGHSEESKKRGRGSSVIRASMDWEILIEKTKKQILWTKMKDAELPNGITFEIIPYGKSAVIKYGEMVEGKSRSSLSKSLQLGLETFKAACSTHHCDCIDLEQWRNEFYSSYSEKNPDVKEGANRNAFNRVKKDLISKGMVKEEQGFYQLSESSVTNRNNVMPVTEDKRNERNTPLKGVTVVTSSEAPLPKIDLPFSQLRIQT